MKRYEQFSPEVLNVLGKYGIKAHIENTTTSPDSAYVMARYADGTDIFKDHQKSAQGFVKDIKGSILWAAVKNCFSSNGKTIKNLPLDFYREGFYEGLDKLLLEGLESGKKKEIDRFSSGYTASMPARNGLSLGAVNIMDCKAAYNVATKAIVDSMTTVVKNEKRGLLQIPDEELSKYGIKAVYCPDDNDYRNERLVVSTVKNNKVEKVWKTIDLSEDRGAYKPWTVKEVLDVIKNTAVENYRDGWVQDIPKELIKECLLSEENNKFADEIIKGVREKSKEDIDQSYREELDPEKKIEKNYEEERNLISEAVDDINSYIVEDNIEALKAIETGKEIGAVKGGED